MVIATFCYVAAAQQIPRPSVPSPASIIETMIKAQSRVHPSNPYEMIREYHLSRTKRSNGDSRDSDVVVAVEFRPPRSKDYWIQKSTGDSRGVKVVRRILDHEMEDTAKGTQFGTASLSPENYDFSYVGEEAIDGQPCYRLALKPRRKETYLVAGDAWLDKRSFLVRRIEGELAKSPSWWLKNVKVTLSFAELEGAWLQTGMQALADVRVLGPYTLSSTMLDFRGFDVVASKAFRPALRSRVPTHRDVTPTTESAHSR
jgi:outer membrane lipoprotein-sorting protein